LSPSGNDGDREFPAFPDQGWQGQDHSRNKVESLQRRWVDRRGQNVACPKFGQLRLASRLRRHAPLAAAGVPVASGPATAPVSTEDADMVADDQP